MVHTPPFWTVSMSRRAPLHTFVPRQTPWPVAGSRALSSTISPLNSTVKSHISASVLRAPTALAVAERRRRPPSEPTVAPASRVQRPGARSFGTGVSRVSRATLISIWLCSQTTARTPGEISAALG